MQTIAPQHTAAERRMYAVYPLAALRRSPTPERPLSDLGRRDYLAYWISTLVRFFRYALAPCASPYH